MENQLINVTRKLIQIINRVLTQVILGQKYQHIHGKNFQDLPEW